jgi:hypothetical protein
MRGRTAGGEEHLGGDTRLPSASRRIHLHPA